MLPYEFAQQAMMTSEPATSKLPLAMDIGNMAYGMYRDWRNRKDYLKQQGIQNQLAHDQLYNAAQIRRRDLEAAGLHPTLAAGAPASAPLPGQGHARSTARGNIDSSAIMLGAMLRKQESDIARTNAETARIRSETDRNVGFYGADLRIKKYIQANQIASYLLANADIENTQARTSLIHLQRSLTNQEIEYTKSTGGRYRMPRQEAYAEQLNELLKDGAFKGHGEAVRALIRILLGR